MTEIATDMKPHITRVRDVYVPHCPVMGQPPPWLPRGYASCETHARAVPCSSAAARQLPARQRRPPRDPDLRLPRGKQVGRLVGAEDAGHADPLVEGGAGPLARRRRELAVLQRHLRMGVDPCRLLEVSHRVRVPPLHQRQGAAVVEGGDQPRAEAGRAGVVCPRLRQPARKPVAVPSVERRVCMLLVALQRRLEVLHRLARLAELEAADTEVVEHVRRRLPHRDDQLEVRESEPPRSPLESESRAVEQRRPAERVPPQLSRVQALCRLVQPHVPRAPCALQPQLRPPLRRRDAERALKGGRCVGVPPFRALELAELMQCDEPFGLVEVVHGPLLRKARRERQPLASPLVVAAEHARQGGAGLLRLTARGLRQGQV
mmetsp:Transcript_45393/g.147528  ORF Transcript_45393/g.147528 Transcript_45393/m.147528 type:complete len:376 (-) Transcript_45393:700-1827(-)